MAKHSDVFTHVMQVHQFLQHIYDTRAALDSLDALDSQGGNVVMELCNILAPEFCSKSQWKINSVNFFVEPVVRVVVSHPGIFYSLFV